MEHKLDFPGSYDFSNISQNDLKVIQQAESQINQNKQNQVILIAYEKSQKA